MIIFITQIVQNKNHANFAFRGTVVMLKDVRNTEGRCQAVGVITPCDILHAWRLNAYGQGWWYEHVNFFLPSSFRQYSMNF